MSLHTFLFCGLFINAVCLYHRLQCSIIQSRRETCGRGHNELAPELNGQYTVQKTQGLKYLLLPCMFLDNNFNTFAPRGVLVLHGLSRRVLVLRGLSRQLSGRSTSTPRFSKTCKKKVLELLASGLYH